MLLEWPPSADHPNPIYDVLPRTAITDGALRAMAQNLLIGEKAEVRYGAGKYAEALILMTGIYIRTRGKVFPNNIFYTLQVAASIFQRTLWFLFF